MGDFVGDRDGSVEILGFVVGAEVGNLVGDLVGDLVGCEEG